MFLPLTDLPLDGLSSGWMACLSDFHFFLFPGLFDRVQASTIPRPALLLRFFSAGHCLSTGYFPSVPPQFNRSLLWTIGGTDFSVSLHTPMDSTT